MTDIGNVFKEDGTQNIELLKNSTLLIPSISIGNIPQLTIDILIHTLDFELIGRLDDTYLYPFVSPVDYTADKCKKGISTAIEVYHNARLNVSLIQQRSPIIPGFTEEFTSKVIIPFVNTASFSKIIILDSSDAGVVTDSQGGKIEHFSIEDLLKRKLDNLTISEQQDIQGSYITSTFSKNLIDNLNASHGLSSIDISALVSYVYEGDNFGDSEIFADKLIEILGMDKVTKWSRPISWLGVYGDRPIPNAMEEGLFG